MTEKITKQDWWLLGLWVAIGFCLRFGNLTLKPVWGDEWATLVFSLGAGFRGIPFDQLISQEILLSPLKFDATTSLNFVTSSLLTESNHPPLYFWLTHLWLRLWSTDGGFISIWVGRSLSALFGVALIPVGFGLGWFCTKMRRVAHFFAVAIAISPFAVYLSQEARHYSLALIWVCLSLGCLVAIIRAVKAGRSPSFQLIIFWLIVNGFGIASHFFMVLHIWAEGLVLLRFYVADSGFSLRKPNTFQAFLTHIFKAPWRRVMLGLLANVVMISILLETWSGNSDSKLTSWLSQDYGFSFEAIAPIGRLLLWLWGTAFTFPLEAQSRIIVIIAAIALVGTFLWLSPQLFRAIRVATKNLESRIFLNVIGANLLTFLGLIYVAKLDVSLAPRYQFIYLPAVLFLIATALNYFWQQNKKPITIAILILMFVGSLATNFDTAYRKPENTRAIAAFIQTHHLADQPLVIATRDRSAAELRTLLGIAWAFQEQKNSISPHFFILSGDNRNPQPILQQSTETLQKDFELWMVNTPVAPSAEQCDRLAEPKDNISGFHYRRFLCPVVLPTSKKSL
ncbi:hypothetical protein NIES208_00795 [[Limnothrix rosea] IAM M-220]|nr:hypothetical protein NIES208_00795 [[Limnothrix rosea] IAM M-220]